MYDDESQSNFPQGVVIFFRQLTSDGSLARSVHPSAREVMIGRHAGLDSHPEDYTILDGNARILGTFPRDYVAAILPLETTGPGVTPNADDRSEASRH
jgi:hypothetical protein